MQEPQLSREPRLRWVPVVDAHGRTHMEARWTAPTPAPTPVATTAGHAA